jgi:tryptophan-rich sensory protein
MVMTTLFHQIEPLAGLLNAPYLLWVTFALVLNYVLIKLNPPAPKGLMRDAVRSYTYGLITC